MKKIILSMAVLATMTLASCQPSATKAEDEGAALKTKIENCQDPDSLKIYVKQAQDYAEKLNKEGDATAAQAYLDEVTTVIQAKDPSVAAIFESLKETADSTVNAKVEEAKEAAADAANSAVNDAKDKASDAVNAAKDKAESAVKDAKDKGTEAVNNAKEKAANAVQSGADKVKNALN